MEKIISIEEDSFNHECTCYSGYLIKTTTQSIKIGIDVGQQCCEETGYFHTNDNVNDFIGAELRDVKITDTCRNTTNLKMEKSFSEIADSYAEGQLMFIDLICAKDVLQFVVYNIHTGYYGHYAIVVSEQLTKLTDL